MPPTAVATVVNDGRALADSIGMVMCDRSRCAAAVGEERWRMDRDIIFLTSLVSPSAVRSVIHDTLETLISDYDSFLIDVYGVLYDGSELFPGVPDVLRKIKSAGKKVVILSNSSLVADVCKAKYAQKGITEGVHYDAFLTSGEVFRVTLKEHIKGQLYAQIFNKNHEIFKSAALREISSIQEADFVYAGSLNGATYGPYLVDELKTKSGAKIAAEDISRLDCAEIDGMDEVARNLQECLKFNKPLVVVNPDIFAIESVGGAKRLILCPGAVGEFYENMGGKVLYFGKPHKAIYDYAKKQLGGCSKTAMVGDTPWTDVLGGTMAGIDTILTLTGIVGKFTSGMESSLTVEQKIERILSVIAPKMTHKNLRGIAQNPTHIVRSLA